MSARSNLLGSATKLSGYRAKITYMGVVILWRRVSEVRCRGRWAGNKSVPLQPAGICGPTRATETWSRMSSGEAMRRFLSGKTRMSSGTAMRGILLFSTWGRAQEKNKNVLWWGDVGFFCLHLLCLFDHENFLRKGNVVEIPVGQRRMCLGLNENVF